jgi:hypothetical protein
MEKNRLINYKFRLKRFVYSLKKLKFSDKIKLKFVKNTVPDLPRQVLGGDGARARGPPTDGP